VSHRLIVVVVTLVVALLIVPAAFAVKVHVRVEGKERTIFGATAPLIDVTPVGVCPPLFAACGSAAYSGWRVFQMCRHPGQKEQ